MKILMFGRGVIATIYGWALEQAGHEIEFLVRPGRAAEYGETIELDLLDARHRPLGERITRSWPVRLREELSPDHDFDLIILSVGHHRLPAAVELLASRLGNATVLVFGSVWTEPTHAIAPLPAQQLAWGFPQAGGGFDDDGILHGVLMRKAVFGTFETKLTERERVVRELFIGAGFRTSEQPEFRGWLWTHFIADAGMHSQGVQLGSLSDMIGHTASFREALLTSRELLAVLQARGVDLRRHRDGVSQFRLPAILMAPVMSFLTARVPLARTSLESHADPSAEEPRRIVRDVLREARRLGVPTPRLDVAGAAIMP